MNEHSHLNLASDLKRRALFEKLLQREKIEPNRASTIPRRSAQTAVPLSFAQERLWFLEQLEPGGAQYNIPVGLRLKGVLNVAALQASLDQIVHRHEALRTTFESVEAQPCQVIAARVPVQITLMDASCFPAAQREVELSRLCAAEARRPFDLAHGPVLRAAVLRLGIEEHIFLLVMHHIASDGWSVSVLMRELTLLYEALSQGRPSPLTDLPIQYADYAVWQRTQFQGAMLDQQLDYWKKQLRDAPALLELPMDRPRPPLQSYRGALARSTLSKPLSVGLKELSRRENASLFMTLMAAFQVLLQRYNGGEDIVIGSPMAGRNWAEVEGLIGFFVNTLVMRGDLSGDPTFQTLLTRTREMALAAYAHQDLPFEKLVESLQPERNPGYSPLFQVMFVFENAPLEAPQLAGLQASPLPFDCDTAKFDLTFFIREERDVLQVVAEYNTDLFEAETIRRMLGHYQCLLEGIVANPEQRLSALPLMTGVERQQILAAWTGAVSAQPKDRCVHELFAEHAACTPEAVALVMENEQLTYRELNSRANQLARHLQKLGVGPDTLVGICMERSLELVVGLMGILKAGGAYVPLDPGYPKERLAFMIEDAKVPVLVTMSAIAASLPPHHGQIIRLDADWPLIAGESADSITSSATAEHLAYVIYTSGSTGHPKGTAIPHRAVVRLVRGQDYAEFEGSQRFLLLASMSFDASTFELWGALLNGSRCVIFPAGPPDLELLEKTIRRHGVTCLWLTAGFFNQIIDLRPSVLETVVHVLTGGEALSVPHIRTAMNLLPSLRLTNGYGPTESTTFTTTFIIRSGETFPTGSVPIGRPLADTQCYLLDAHLQPVPVGVAAELYIGGDGLARGYLNQPELTAEKFVANPYSQNPKARLYRTGDRCRWLPDGNIEFIGRLDGQLKLRGFRIELGEVEAQLNQHPEVRESVVVARADAAGNKRLVAYVVKRNGSVPAADLREFLSAKLPDYMLPSLYADLEKLPLTANGKVDRKSLPDPDFDKIETGQGYHAPRNYSEQVLCNIWREVLNLKQVSTHDNFFELGGHSLLAVRLIDTINKRLKVNLNVPAFFQNPTIEKLGKILEQKQLIRREPQLLALQPGQSEGSLFLLDAGIGLCRLAELFGAGPASFATVVPLPPNAFRAAALNHRASLPSLKELAAPHTALILKQSPTEPCFLMGHSFGGLLAFEVAHQLRREGRPVEMVFLLDSWARDLTWWRKLKQLTFERAKKSLRFRAKRLWANAYAKSARVTDRIQVISKTPNQMNPDGEDVNLPFGEVPWEVLSKVYQNAKKNYRLHPLDSRAILFRAQNSEEVHLSTIDGNMGWSGQFQGGLEIVECPGDHFTLLKAPNLQFLIQQLQESIKKQKSASKV